MTPDHAMLCVSTVSYYDATSGGNAVSANCRWGVLSEQVSIQSARVLKSPTPTRNAPKVAAAFSPRTMATGDAGDKPTRMSTTLVCVRAYDK